MRGHGVAAPRFDVADHALEPLVRKRLDLAAVVADDVVVVMFVFPNGFEAHYAVAEVEPLHEPPFGENVEHAVDAREPDPLALRLQLAMNVLGSEAALLGLEELDHAA